MEKPQRNQIRVLIALFLTILIFSIENLETRVGSLNDQDLSSLVNLLSDYLEYDSVSEMVDNLIDNRANISQDPLNDCVYYAIGCYNNETGIISYPKGDIDTLLEEMIHAWQYNNGLFSQIMNHSPNELYRMQLEFHANVIKALILGYSTSLFSPDFDGQNIYQILAKKLRNMPDQIQNELLPLLLSTEWADFIQGVEYLFFQLEPDYQQEIIYNILKNSTFENPHHTWMKDFYMKLQPRYDNQIVPRMNIFKLLLMGVAEINMKVPDTIDSLPFNYGEIAIEYLSSLEYEERYSPPLPATYLNRNGTVIVFSVANINTEDCERHINIFFTDGYYYGITIYNSDRTTDLVTEIGEIIIQNHQVMQSTPELAFNELIMSILDLALKSE
jgi:hypothetical protein